MSNKQAPPFGNASDMVPGPGSSAESVRSGEAATEAVVEVSRHDTAPFDPYLRQEFAFTTETRRTLLGLEPAQADAAANTAAPFIEEPEVFESAWGGLPGSAGADPLARNAPTVPSLRRRAALAPPAVPDLASLPAAGVSTPRVHHRVKGWAAVLGLALLAFGAAFAASGSGEDPAASIPHAGPPNHGAVPGTVTQAQVRGVPANAPNIESSKAPAAKESPLPAAASALQRTANAAAPRVVISTSPPLRSAAPARTGRANAGQRLDAAQPSEAPPRNGEQSEANAAKKRLWFPPE